MNKKIKILGLSAFIATGMAPFGATQIFADEVNPTQIEEKINVGENDGEENNIEYQEDVEYQEDQDTDDTYQDANIEENQDTEETNEDEDINIDEDYESEDNEDIKTVINEDVSADEEQGTEETNEDEDINIDEDFEAEDNEDIKTVVNEDVIDYEGIEDANDNEDSETDQNNSDLDDTKEIILYDHLENKDSNNKENVEQQATKESDIPKTFDGGISGYVGTMLASMGGIFVLARKMM